VIDDTDLRISVAEIKGMLTATLARHDQRLDQHEAPPNHHERPLKEKGKPPARHDERLRGLEEDNSARWSRVLGVLALVASGIGVLYSILNP